MAFRHSLICALLLILFSSQAKAEPKVMAVQSFRAPPYEAVISGFDSVTRLSTQRIVLSETVDFDMEKKVNQARPSLILAIGMDALSRVKAIQNVPIVYLMVLNPSSVIDSENNMCGISMRIAPKEQLEIISGILPGVRRVGTIFDPKNSGELMKDARKAAAKIGIRLIANEVESVKDAPGLLNELTGKIDAFWMIPDISVIKPETVEHLLLLSIETKTPVITFSEKYLEMGALMSISLDPFLLGRQAGKISKGVLSGTGPECGKLVDPSDVSVSISMKIARKLNVTIDEKAARKAKFID